MSAFLIPAVIIIVVLYVWFLIFIPVARMHPARQGKIEDALAERERMLQLLWQHDGHFIADLDYDDWYDDLRARADKP